MTLRELREILKDRLSSEELRTIDATLLQIDRLTMDLGTARVVIAAKDRAVSIYRAGLLANARRGRVCSEFLVCAHVACADSATSMIEAREALRSVEPEIQIDEKKEKNG